MRGFHPSRRLPPTSRAYLKKLSGENNMNKSVQRFPRCDVWKGIPKLDLSKIKSSRWVIDLFLAQASTQLIYGSFGTRKTTAMLKAAWAVSQGQDFLGRKTRQRCVLYLDYENPPDVLKSYCQDLGIDPSVPAFTIWDRSAGPTPLPADEKLEKFVRHCKEATGHHPWIIFDSWTSLLKSGDSGDKIGEATPIFRAIRHLCDIGATCTIIDHTGKSKRKDPIGTSAKMTQMDTSHYFEAQRDETTLLNSDSSRTVIRVASFLKRYAPKHVGTFSFEVRADVDNNGRWHLRSLQATKDIAVLKMEKEIEGMKDLIKLNPTKGHEELAVLAAGKHVSGRNRARQLLLDGIGKHWETMTKGKSHKRVFRVLKIAK
jgi:RecA-family ATPase